MSELIHSFSANGVVFLALAFSSLCVICATIKSILKSASRERTKREIAAYIAEGSMTPEEGARLVASRPGNSGCCDS